MESLFYVYFRKLCSRANQIACHDYRRKSQNHRFCRNFIWPTREYYFWRLLGAPGSSCQLLGAPWAPMVAPGGSWRKFMKTYCCIEQTVYFSLPSATRNVSHDLYSGSLKICGNHCFVDFWIQCQKSIKSAPWGFIDFQIRGYRVV